MLISTALAPWLLFVYLNLCAASIAFVLAWLDEARRRTPVGFLAAWATLYLATIILVETALGVLGILTPLRARDRVGRGARWRFGSDSQGQEACSRCRPSGERRGFGCARFSSKSESRSSSSWHSGLRRPWPSRLSLNLQASGIRLFTTCRCRPTGSSTAQSRRPTFRSPKWRTVTSRGTASCSTSGRWRPSATTFSSAWHHSAYGAFWDSPFIASAASAAADAAPLRSPRHVFLFTPLVLSEATELSTDVIGMSLFVLALGHAFEYRGTAFALSRRAVWPGQRSLPGNEIFRSGVLGPSAGRLCDHPLLAASFAARRSYGGRS